MAKIDNLYAEFEKLPERTVEDFAQENEKEKQFIFFYVTLFSENWMGNFPNLQLYFHLLYFNVVLTKFENQHPICQNIETLYFGLYYLK